MPPAPQAVQWDVDRERLFQMLDPDGAGAAARLFRMMHHALVALGTGLVLADSVPLLRRAHGGLLAVLFGLVSASFAIEYAARL